MISNVIVIGPEKRRSVQDEEGDTSEEADVSADFGGSDVDGGDTGYRYIHECRRLAGVRELPLDFSSTLGIIKHIAD